MFSVLLCEKIEMTSLSKYSAGLNRSLEWCDDIKSDFFPKQYLCIMVLFSLTSLITSVNKKSLWICGFSALHDFLIKFSCNWRSSNPRSFEKILKKSSSELVYLLNVISSTTDKSNVVILLPASFPAGLKRKWNFGIFKKFLKSSKFSQNFSQKETKMDGIFVQFAFVWFLEIRHRYWTCFLVPGANQRASKCDFIICQYDPKASKT